LVVDVTTSGYKRDFKGFRENLNLVERFNRVDDKTLEYAVTVRGSDDVDPVVDRQAGMGESRTTGFTTSRGATRGTTASSGSSSAPDLTSGPSRKGSVLIPRRSAPAIVGTV
jgi:hypothetical protein